MSEDRPAVFFIDDDPSLRRSLDSLLRSVALEEHTVVVTITYY